MEYRPEDARLIRIVGARRVPDDDTDPTAYSTHYTWRLVYTEAPGGASILDQRPRDYEPRMGAGPRPEDDDDEGPAPTPAIEVSGSDAVPTDGTVVVWAWYDETSTCLRFQYTGRRFARIDGLVSTDDGAHYAWTEMEPAAPGTEADSGFNWQKKWLGMTGGKPESTPPRSPLYELNGNPGVPKGWIVEIFRAPVRVDPATHDSFHRGAVEAEITTTQEPVLGSAQQYVRLQLREVVAGTFRLTMTRLVTGVTGTTGWLAWDASIDTIKAALDGLGGTHQVTGALPSVLIGTPDYDRYLFTVDTSRLVSDAPWFFVWPASLDGAWAQITGRGFTADGLWIYGWKNRGGTPNGGWEDVGLVGTTGAWVEVTKTSTDPAAEAYTVTPTSATSGTFKLKVDGSETTALAYNAATSTIAAALIAAGAGLVDSTAIVFAAAGAHTLVFSENSLKPKPSNPAFEVNNLKVNLNTIERLWKTYISHPGVKVTRTATGDGDAVAAAFTVKVRDTNGGTYTLTYRFAGVDYETDPIAWDADATAVASAINTAAGDTAVTVSGWVQTADDVSYTVTGTDFDDFDLDGDGGELTGRDDYRFRGAKPAEACPGTDVPGFVPGGRNFLTLDDAGCLKCVQTEECTTP